MNIATGVTGEASAEGQPGGHLAEASHDHEDEGTDEGVGDEQGARAGVGEGLSGADDEACAEGASNGNHGDVAGLEAAVQLRVLGRLEAADVDAVAGDGRVVVVVAIARLLDVRAGRLVEAAHDESALSTETEERMVEERTVVVMLLL